MKNMNFLTLFKISRESEVSHHEPVVHPEMNENVLFSVGAHGRAPLRVVFTETME
jgi:hypothetical protein